MTPQKWIVAAAAGIVVLLALGLLLGRRILAAAGVERAAVLPQRSAHEGTAPVQRREGVTKADRDRVGGLLDLTELEVSDVMVHRTNMRSVNADNPPEAVVREILQSPHTRMPLWRGSLDNIVGVIHAKDLLRALDDVGNDLSQVDIMKIACKALVRAGHDTAARSAQRLPEAQGAFRHRGR